MPIYYLTRTQPLTPIGPNLPIIELYESGSVVSLRNYFYQNQGPLGPFENSTLLGINKIDQPIYTNPAGGANLYNVFLITINNTTQKYVRANSFTAAKDYTEELSPSMTSWTVNSIINLGFVN